MKRYSPFQRCAATAYMAGGIAVFGGVNTGNNMGVSDLIE